MFTYKHVTKEGLIVIAGILISIIVFEGISTIIWYFTQKEEPELILYPTLP